MRKPYLVRLGNLQAQLAKSPPEQHGHLVRNFLAHEASTTRNLKKSTILTPDLLNILSLLPRTTFTGSLPYPPDFSMATIYSVSDSTFTLLIYNQKTSRQIYSKTISLNQEINKD